MQAYVSYEQLDTPATRNFIDKCPTDDPDSLIVQACLLFQEKKFEESKQKFVEALNTLGYKPSIAYNIALCYFMMKHFTNARKYIIEIIEKGIKEHPGIQFQQSQYRAGDR